MTTIALIDEHLIVRSGFAQLLGLEADFQVVAEFGTGPEALADLPGRGSRRSVSATFRCRIFL
jgi:two-component system uhpT operon response regulator UhpA